MRSVMPESARITVGQANADLLGTDNRAWSAESKSNQIKPNQTKLNTPSQSTPS